MLLIRNWIVGLSVAAIAVTCGISTASAQTRSGAGGAMKPVQPAEKPKKMTIYDIKVVTNEGKEIKLEEYKGKAMLIVNTASKCGYTPQYADLQKLYETYKDDGLVVLAFPSNDFGDQEPLENPEILEFCTGRFNTKFPLFSKVHVKDATSACDLYKYLIDKKTNKDHSGEIKWNFTKFLVDPKGEIVGRFESPVKPTASTICEQVEKVLKIEKKGDDKKSEEGESSVRPESTEKE